MSAASGFVVAGLLVGLGDPGGRPPGADADVVWVAPPGCPERDELLAGVARRRGRPLAAGQARVFARITAAGPRRFRMALELDVDGRHEARVLAARTCAALVDAAALRITLAVDGDPGRDPRAPAPIGAPPDLPLEPVGAPEPPPAPPLDPARGPASPPGPPDRAGEPRTPPGPPDRAGEPRTPPGPPDPSLDPLAPPPVGGRAPPRGPVAPAEPGGSRPLDPPADGAAPGERPPADDASPESRPLDPPADEPPPPAPARRRRPGGFLRLAGLGEVGALPGPTGGVALAGGLVWPRARLEVHAAYLAPRTAAAPQAEVRASLVAGAVLGCASPGRGALEVPLCGGLEVGGMPGAAAGPGVGGTAVGDWLAAVVTVGASWRIRPRLALWGALHGLAAARRTVFVLREPGPELVLFDPGVLSARLALGVELRFGDRR